MCLVPFRSVFSTTWPRAFTFTTSRSVALAAPVVGSGHRVAPATSFESSPLPLARVTPYSHAVVCPPPPVSTAVRLVIPAGPWVYVVVLFDPSVGTPSV